VWRLLTLAVVAGLVTPAAARPGGGGDDYDPASTEWNGLSSFAALVKSTGRSFEARTEIAWSDLGADDALFIVYPTVDVDPVRLAEFIRGGGRVLLADDFGHSHEALARLGLLRHRATSGGNRAAGGNPHLPVARVTAAAHPLASGVSELYTNHPAAFTSSGGADVVFALGSDDVIVAAGQMGEGRYVALADPSVLINEMQAYDGDLAFTVNLLDWLAAPGGRVVFVSHEFQLYGEPQPVKGAAGTERTGADNDVFATIGNWLDDLNAYMAPAEALRGLGLVLAGIIFVAAAVVIPLRRDPEPDGSFARAGGDPPTTERLLAEYDDDHANRNYAYPAAILRENVLASIEPGPHGLAPADADRRKLAERLPTRADVLTTRAFVGRRAFLDACDVLMPPRSEGD
jgi:hypothetical protein